MDWNNLFSPPTVFVMKSILLRHVSGVTKDFGGQVLDAGCGAQPYRPYIPCETYVPVDWPARRPLVGADVAHLPFAAASFDAVLCTEVIEHVPFPDEVLAEIQRVLREGGTACLSAPMAWGLHHEPYDFFRYTRYGLARLAATAGLQTIRVERIGGMATLIGVLLADFQFRLIAKIVWFLPLRARVVLGAVLLWPWSLATYLGGPLLDRLERKNAVGWMAVLRKPAGEAP